MRFRSPLAVAVTLVAVLATGACGGGGEGDQDEDTAPATGRFGQIHQGVCASAQFAAADDAERSKEAFDDAHFGLHALIQAVEDEDRAAAARLLEATELVEREHTADHLEALAEEVAAAVEQTGGTAPDTCP